MEYGIFSSALLEIAQTKYWALCFYCNADKSMIGSRLYNGVDEYKTLVGICERDIYNNRTVYAYEAINNMKHTNDFDGVCKLIGTPFEYNVSELTKTETIMLSQPYTMPTVSECGIENCLKRWRLGTFYMPMNDGMLFRMITDRTEYVFSIQNSECNIYCGASINIPDDDGMLGQQYFRIRNYADNTTPNCRFECNLGNLVDEQTAKRVACASDKCSSITEGMYWSVKRHNDEEIVLAGCGGDEYIYSRNAHKSEYFKYEIEINAKYSGEENDRS